MTGTHSGTIKLKTPYVAIWMVALAYDSGFILPKKAVEALPDGRLMPGCAYNMFYRHKDPRFAGPVGQTPIWGSKAP